VFLRRLVEFRRSKSQGIATGRRIGFHSPDYFAIARACLGAEVGEVIPSLWVVDGVDLVLGVSDEDWFVIGVVP
jgi:hypothetical protein